MEHKQTEPIILSTDESQGIVEAIWAVMGNVDGGGDVIHPGAFTKTFTERSQQVKLLDNHRTDSVLSALGTVLELRELGKSELPANLTQHYPEATGGAWGRFQFLLDTPEGKGAFTRIQRGAVKEWSFGYDTTKRDHDSIERDGRKVTVRNLRELKLYEVSPVLFGMNEATITTRVKALNLSELVENVRQAFNTQYNPPNGMWRYWVSTVYDEYIIVCYDSEGGAEHYQVSYLVDGDKYTFAPMGEWIEGYYEFIPKAVSKAGRVLSGRNATRIQAALDALHETLKEAGVYDPDEDEEDKDGWLCNECYKGLGKEYECFTDSILPGKCAYCGNKEVKHHLVKLPKNGATEPQKSNALTSNSEAEPLQDESTRQIIELELEALKLLEV